MANAGQLIGKPRSRVCLASPPCHQTQLMQGLCGTSCGRRAPLENRATTHDGAPKSQ